MDLHELLEYFSRQSSETYSSEQIRRFTVIKQCEIANSRPANNIPEAYFRVTVFQIAHSENIIDNPALLLAGYRLNQIMYTLM